MTRKTKIDNPAQLELFGTPLQKPTDFQRPAFELQAPSSPSQDHRTHYSPELIEKAMILFSRGVSYKTVANSLAIPIYTAREWKHRYRNHTLGEYISGKPAKGRYSAAVKDRVILMRVQFGMSYNRIVQETGISRATIRSWLADVGPIDRKSKTAVAMDEILMKLE